MVQVSDRVKEYLQGLDGICEATNDERYFLWRLNAAEAGIGQRSWIEYGEGYGVAIGHVNDSIVMLSLMIAEVDGKKILFYHPTSVMVDWNMIWNWLKEVLPEAYSNRTDAGNFHNILR